MYTKSIKNFKYTKNEIHLYKICNFNARKEYYQKF